MQNMSLADAIVLQKVVLEARDSVIKSKMLLKKLNRSLARAVIGERGLHEAVQCCGLVIVCHISFMLEFS